MTVPTPPTTLRLAMWSGPRNISTALMRSWEARGDTAVVDEPFYAHYLSATDARHPGREAILAAQPTDWRRVVDVLLGPVPGGRPIWYQKHMAHHLAGIDLDAPETLGEGGWLRRLTSCFLIREPAEVIRSFCRIVPDPRPEDLGMIQQLALFERLRRLDGTTPPVLDARDVLEDPEALLRVLCRAVGVSFTPAMLSWPPGPRPTDGVWLDHWYGNVARSTRFAPPGQRVSPDDLGRDLWPVYEACLEPYERLRAHRMGPGDVDVPDRRTTAGDAVG